MKIHSIKSKKAQVWIETVIYTLIGIAIIGILLAVSKPKIDSMKDKLVIEQTIDSLNKINDKIYEIQQAPGNKRGIELKISQGRLIFDAQNDVITWTLDSQYKYSEPGTWVDIGNLQLKTTEGKPYQIEIKKDYHSTLNLKNAGTEESKEIDSAPSPYTIYVENLGTGSDSRPSIDITIK